MAIFTNLAEMGTDEFHGYEMETECCLFALNLWQGWSYLIASRMQAMLTVQKS